MHLAIVSDTHIPERADGLPDEFRDRIARADHTIHAGDVADADALADLRGLATELTAVHGNADPAGLGLPPVATVAAGGVTVVAAHGTRNPVEAAVRASTGGSVMTRRQWCDAIADTARARTRSWDGTGVVGVGGHTHQVEDVVHEGVRLLNPGSATGAEPAEDATMLAAEVTDGTVDVTIHEA